MDWTDAAHYSSVIAADHGGARQYIQLTEKTLAGVRAADGKVTSLVLHQGGRDMPGKKK